MFSIRYGVAMKCPPGLLANKKTQLRHRDVSMGHTTMALPHIYVAAFTESSSNSCDLESNTCLASSKSVCGRCSRQRFGSVV